MDTAAYFFQNFFLYFQPDAFPVSGASNNYFYYLGVGTLFPSVFICSPNPGVFSFFSLCYSLLFCVTYLFCAIQCLFPLVLLTLLIINIYFFISSTLCTGILSILGYRHQPGLWFQKYLQVFCCREQHGNICPLFWPGPQHLQWLVWNIIVTENMSRTRKKPGPGSGSWNVVITVEACFQIWAGIRTRIRVRGEGSNGPGTHPKPTPWLASGSELWSGFKPEAGQKSALATGPGTQLGATPEQGLRTGS